MKNLSEIKEEIEYIAQRIDDTIVDLGLDYIVLFGGLIFGPLIAMGCNLACNYQDNKEETKQEIILKKPTYSSQGMDIVMSGRSSNEILTKEQLERKLEWNQRNRHFLECDSDNGGSLDNEELEKYLSSTKFKNRYR